MKSTKDRSLLTNSIICVCCLVGILLFPTFFELILHKFINNESLCSFLGSLLYIVILVIIFMKDLKIEFKNYKSKFKENFKIGFKYYIIGVFAMIIFNLIIAFYFKNGVSANESTVREQLFSYPVFTFLQIMITAPLGEELVFRKSVRGVFKNKLVCSIISGLLFGGAHLIAGSFTLSNLVYLLPYGSLGFVFAYMNFETKSTFTSITFHSLHNTVTGILLLALYAMGVA